MVLALKHHGRGETSPSALAVVVPLSASALAGDSWLAHDLAFRLLAEMRIDVYRELDPLAPAYLVRRRTGDLVALASHDIELVEYFFAHTIAPAFVAVLVPAAVLAALGWRRRLAGSGAAAVPGGRRAEPLPAAQARRSARRPGARGGRRARRIRRRLGAGPGRDRRLPAGGAGAASRLDELSQRHIELRLPFFRELTVQHAILEILIGLGGLAVVVVGALLSAEGRDRSRPAAAAHAAGDGGVPAGLGDRPDRPPARRHAGRHAARLRARQRAVPVRDGPGRARSSNGRRAALALEASPSPIPARRRRALSRRHLRHSGRPDGRAGRHLRRRQDHRGAPADALLGPGRRPHHAERRRPRGLQARRSAPA